MIVRILSAPRGAVLAALVLACFCALVPGAAAVTIATGSFQAGSVGQTTSIPVVLDSVPAGISGYKITVALSDPSVAEITAAAFPAWATLNSASPLPAGQVTLQGVDLSAQVPVGGTSVTLVTLTVRAKATGSTAITITPDPTLGVQDRSGNLYAATPSPGTLTVGTAPAPTGAPTTGPTSPVLTPVPPTAVPTPVSTSVVTTPVVVTPAPISTQIGTTPVLQPPAPIDTVVPVGTAVPIAVSPTGATGVTSPVVVAPVAQPTVGFGKRYAVGNPGSFIGTRFGSGGTVTTPRGSGSVTAPDATLKPGSRAYGVNPPTSKFVRWYPAARWAAGIR